MLARVLFYAGALNVDGKKTLKLITNGLASMSSDKSIGRQGATRCSMLASRRYEIVPPCLLAPL